MSTTTAIPAPCPPWAVSPIGETGGASSSTASSIPLPQLRPCSGCSSSHSATSSFSPPPEAISAILADLGRPDYTFRDIAEMHGTNADALTIWLTRPEIEERLAAIESAIARRTRLIATNYLPSAVKTVTRILDEHNDEESQRAGRPIAPRTPQHGEPRRRTR